MPRTPSSLFLLAVLAAAAPWAQAQPISLVPNTINIFRDTRGANDVSVTAGDRVQMGAGIAGGSAGASMGFLYAPTGFSADPFPCSPLTVDPNFCSRAPAFSADRLGSWTLNFGRGTDTLSVATPTLFGAEQKVPFPVSVTISGSGSTPTISWVVPGGFTPDGIRVQVFDKSKVNPVTGAVDIIHSVAVNPTAGSYTLPATLSTGLVLATGGNYTINFQLVDTRGDVVFTNNNAQILRRSNSYFAFTPLAAGAPLSVHLPTVDAGVYNFAVESVGPSSTTFIDPLVAIGYKYAKGASDPNFRSVLLPNIGDGKYTLSFSTLAGAQSVSLDQGVQFFFPEGGVGAFDVTGIETSAMLDPANATAFITGLTFSAAGSFTGTMTPLTVDVAVAVPEPETYALMAMGLLALAVASRRRSRTFART